MPESGQDEERCTDSVLEHGPDAIEDGDFDDAFLREVARASVPPRLPVPGMRVGDRDGKRYEVLEELGGGAMGQVFRALDSELQRPVALKFLVPHESIAEAPMISLLRQEGRAIAQLDHEHIVRIFNVDLWSSGPTEPPVPFLVMECLEGESLSSLLRRGRPGHRRAMEILDAVASGLAHAHERHIVHRDLKPSNVFITRSGVVKILDFGLSWLVAASAAPDVTLSTAGTPPYMAPEQWRGEAQDSRTDLWAAGVLLYEMLAGEPPFLGTPESIRERVTSQGPVPAVRERELDVPEPVEGLLAELLAKAPEARLRSATELRERLREVEEGLAPRREPRRVRAPQRRQVTLVACRLADLAGLAGRLDAEDLGELEAAFHRSCSEVLRQQGGTVVLCVGEEVLGCFGHPVAREDDSERALRAALRLAATVAPTLQESLASLPERKLTVTVGVHTDTVVLDDASIQGEAPRVAAWLARQATPGTVWISDSTDALTRGAFVTQAMPPLRFTGLSGVRDVTPYRLVQPRRVTSRFDRGLVSRSLTPLVGRKGELQFLLEQWEEARAGRGSCVLVTGEAGIGKSRLVREVRERVPPFMAHLLRGQCWPQSTTSAFAPVIDLLRRMLELDAEGTPKEHRAKLEAGLGVLGLGAGRTQLLSGLVGLSGDEGAPHLRYAPERLKQETLDALAHLLARLAEQRPVLLEVEDLHWADPSSLQLLGFLLERLPELRVCMLLTSRVALPPPWGDDSRVQRLALERLPPPVAGELVRKAAGDRPLSSELVAQLVRRTDGIPLFAEELTRRVVEEPRGGESASVEVPVSLRELLLTRLDRLPGSQKELAQVCAVVGRSFSHALLSALSGRTETSLRADLSGLVAEGLLQPAETVEPSYGFRHALIQDAAADSLPRKARRQYHRRVARVLAEQFPEVTEAQPELLAWHYTESGQAEAAIRWWARAGEMASRRMANVEAISHLRQALSLLRAQRPSRTLDGEELRLLLGLALSLVQVQGYSSPEVESVHARVRFLMRELEDDLPRLEPPHWVAFAHAFARAHWDEAHEVAERLVRLGKRHGQRELLALGYRMRATDFFTWGRLASALENVELALTFSDFELERHQMLAVKHWVNPRVAALAYAAVLHAVMDAPHASREHARQGLRLAMDIGHANTSAFALLYAALAAQLRREPREALELCDRNIALSREHHFRLWLGWSTLIRAWAQALLGNAREGLALMQAALGHWRRSGFKAGLPHNLGMLAEIQLLLGQKRQALDSLHEALGEAGSTGERSYEVVLRGLEAEALSMMGREDEALLARAHALRVAETQGALGYGRLVRERRLGHPLLELPPLRDLQAEEPAPGP
ncbi:protein kinase [Myxococcus sp. CA051A]|uniref:protein kinase domain-containing protein n=1 Tax=unclassified Myxococcus TaxID=2648731 RepID=UPI00157AE9A0|nr:MULTISPECIES: protein kinase [unclassified Myxococcus]NTX51412.1 protein kinase [Myxococcus sp. CA039A]NTX64073.1 protein kinase [Myxococcus sp. CA051A]